MGGFAVSKGFFVPVPKGWVDRRGIEADDLSVENSVALIEVLRERAAEARE